MSTIERITWEQIYPIWRDKLWPGRETEIKPTNGIVLLGGFDKGIEKNTPTFFGVFVDDGELVGVNSGFKTSATEYRSRGLYVEPEYRRQGIAQLLLYAAQEQAILEGCELMWSMPRYTALVAYQKFGFTKESNFFDEKVEFGPNCFAVKRIL